MFTFKNVGKEICFWARFFLTVLTVLWMLAVCLGAVALYQLLDRSGIGDMLPGAAIILPVVGGILAFLIGYVLIRLSTIKFYAQGKTVVYLASIDSRLAELAAAQSAPVWPENPYAVPAVQVEKPVGASAAQLPVEGPVSAPVEEVTVPEPVKKGFCMNCGNENPDDAMFCTNCGTPLS